MAGDGRILRRLVPALLECLLLLHVMGNVSPVKGDCIWYGDCHNDTEFKRFNCYYKGPAKPVQDETRYILEKYCPQFASSPVCCDNDQLINLKTNIALAENILARCPSCMDNFLQHICGMTCDPNQGDYIKPVTIQQFNSTHQRVTAIDYHLSATYKEATYISCQDVPVPESNGTALDLMCGDYGAANCTADRLFQFMGDAYDNPFVPFQINYVGEHLDGYTPYNPPTRGRNFITEQGCYEITPTTQDIERDRIVVHRPETEIDSLITVKEYSDLTLDESTKKIVKTKDVGKTGCRTFNCELHFKQEERKLQLEEDYYTFKMDYLRQKLVLLREQTIALKTIANKMPWQGYHIGK